MSAPWWVDPRDLGSDFAKIEQQWATLREVLDDPAVHELRNAAVSGWDCGEHAGHAVLVAHSMARVIESSLAHPDRNVDGAWTEHTGAVLEAGRFPRGRAKTPEPFDPQRSREKTSFGHSGTRPQPGRAYALDPTRSPPAQRGRAT
ncbi:MAG: hypothetical protein WEB90_02605 [Gemmatimonadota bacterium]